MAGLTYDSSTGKLSPASGAPAPASSASSGKGLFYDSSTGQLSKTPVATKAPAPSTVIPMAAPNAPLGNTAPIQGAAAVPGVTQVKPAPVGPFMPGSPDPGPQLSKSTITPVSQPVGDLVPTVPGVATQPANVAPQLSNQKVLPTTGVDGSKAPTYTPPTLLERFLGQVKQSPSYALDLPKQTAAGLYDSIYNPSKVERSAETYMGLNKGGVTTPLQFAGKLLFRTLGMGVEPLATIAGEAAGQEQLANKVANGKAPLSALDQFDYQPVGVGEAVNRILPASVAVGLMLAPFLSDIPGKAALKLSDLVQTKGGVKLTFQDLQDITRGRPDLVDPKKVEAFKNAVKSPEGQSYVQQMKKGYVEIPDNKPNTISNILKNAATRPVSEIGNIANKFGLDKPDLITKQIGDGSAPSEGFQPPTEVPGESPAALATTEGKPVGFQPAEQGLTPLEQMTTLYRGGGEGSMPKGMTAKEVINYEQQELGNNITVEKGVDLSKIKSDNLQWLTKTQADAEQYGETQQVAGNFRVIAHDPFGGVLVDTSTPIGFQPAAQANLTPVEQLKAINTPSTLQPISYTAPEPTAEEKRAAELERQRGSTQAFADIEKTIEKFKQDSADARAGEVLRSKYVGEEGQRIVKANHLFDDMEKLVSNPLEQEALNLYRNFKEDPAGLKAILDGTHPAYQEAIDFYKEHNPGVTQADVDAFRMNALKDVQKFIKPIELAMNPSESLLAADKAYTEFAKSHLEEGKKLGFLESSIKPENYVPQMTTPSVKPRSFANKATRGKLGRPLEHAMKREFATPLHAVIAGAKPKVLNAVTLGRIYAQRHAAQAATTLFLKELADTQLAELNGGNVPEDWKAVKVGKKLIFLPPTIADAVGPLLETNPDLPMLENITKFQLLVKSGEVAASIFHAKALTLTAFNSMGPKAFAEATISGLDTPLFRENEIDFVKAGGTTSELGKTAESYKLANKGSALSKMDKLRQAPGISLVLAASDELTKLTFDIAQRKFKVLDYTLQRDAWLAKHPDATAEEFLNQKVAIAKDVNATYGGLNLDVLGQGRITRAVARVLFFAPDWTYSNVLKGKYIFTNEGARWNAFKFFLYSAVTTLALSQAASLMIGHKLSKHLFKVYLGKDKNGKEMYGNWFAVGAFGDLVNWVTNMQKQGALVGTAQTVGNKMASIPRSAIHLITNANYLGQTITVKGASPVVNTIRAAEEVASENIPLPFGLVDAIKYVFDQKTARNFWDYATIIAGQATSHEVPKGYHVPTTGAFKGQVVPDKPGQGVNRPEKSILEQLRTGKVYDTVPRAKKSVKR